MVQAKVDRCLVTGPTTEDRAEIQELRQEVADQQRTIEILSAATTFFGHEADVEVGDSEAETFLCGVLTKLARRSPSARTRRGRRSSTQVPPAVASG